MRNPIDIDSKHSRAIVREIGEGLRASFKEDQELPANLRVRLERLRQSERGAMGSSKHRDQDTTYSAAVANKIVAFVAFRSGSNLWNAMDQTE